MSLSRQLLRDICRMIELHHGPPGSRSSSFNNHRLSRAVLDVREEGDTYIVEAELPGVRKDNLEIRIGDGGKSVTIEAKTVQPRGGEAPSKAIKAIEDDGTASNGAAATGQRNQISPERPSVRNSSCSRSVWFQRPVDVHNAVAKLDHGILTLKLKRAKDQGSIVVPIE